MSRIEAERLVSRVKHYSERDLHTYGIDFSFEQGTNPVLNSDGEWSKELETCIVVEAETPLQVGIGTGLLHAYLDAASVFEKVGS